MGKPGYFNDDDEEDECTAQVVRPSAAEIPSQDC